jgi:hypothetical protein
MHVLRRGRSPKPTWLKVKPNPETVRMHNMIKRRTLLSALPLGILSPLLAACARAQPIASVPTQAPAESPMSAQVLAFFGATPRDIVWLKFTGSVRLVADNANPRPATLLRALGASKDGTATRFFDVWQTEGEPVKAGPSDTRGQAETVLEANDLGTQGIALARAFAHPAFDKPYEFTRLTPQNGRILAIDNSQIWLLDGGISAPPPLDSALQTTFAAWRAA